MRKKILALPLMFLLFCLFGTISVFAAENEYYMVDGRVYSDGTGEINRIDIVKNIPSVTIRQGDENSYVLLSTDDEGEIINMAVLDINFKIGADAGGGYSDYAEYSALLPVDDDVYAFFLVNSEYDALAEAYLDEYVQSEILYFNVTESEGGYSLDWKVEVDDDESLDLLEYDVMTVSTNSSEVNVLAYRTNETSLFVPFDWLDPNDTIVFELRSNDGRSTLISTSNEFSTPDGADKNIADNDTQWADSENEEEPSAVDYVVVAVVVIVLVIVVAVIVVLLVKKLKLKNKKDSNQEGNKNS